MDPSLLSLRPGRPLAEQIYEGLARAIADGKLAAGERLPASRRLADDLGVSRNTVLSAYQQLQAEGYLQTAGAGGTRVAGDLPVLGTAATRRRDTAARARAPRLSRAGRGLLRHPTIFAPLTTADREKPEIDFDYNVNISDPRGREAWSRALRRAAARFETTIGSFDFRRRPGPAHEAVARHLRLTRGVRTEPDGVLLLPSVQAALSIAVEALCNPGDAVALEDPHYLGMRTAARTRGVRAIPIPVDEQGLCTDRLPRPSTRARILYTTPSHQWPTGVVQPVARRLAALEWARKNRAWILENDHNCEYRYEGPAVPSIQGLDESGSVIYVGAFTRLFSPPPAMGFLVVPPSLIDVFRAAALVGGHFISRVETEAMGEFLLSGEIERLLRRVWRSTRERRGRLLAALRGADLGDARIHAAASGLHLHVAFPGATGEDVDRAVRRAEERGVGVYPDTPFRLRPTDAPGILVGFASPPIDRIDEGVDRLSGAIRETLGS